jgi:hypothetical protein
MPGRRSGRTWIFGRKVVLPAGVIERIDVDNRKVEVRLKKQQIGLSDI